MVRTSVGCEGVVVPVVHVQNEEVRQFGLQALPLVLLDNRRHRQGTREEQPDEQTTKTNITNQPTN